MVSSVYISPVWKMTAKGSHTFVSNAIGRNVFEMPMPSVEEAIRRKFDSEKYLQCVYANLQTIDTTESSKDPDQRSLKESLTYKVRLVGKANAIRPVYAASVKLSDFYQTPTTTKMVVNQFNYECMSESWGNYKRVPFFIDWVPSDFAKEDYENATAIAKFHLGYFQITDYETYGELTVPPNANVIKMYPTIDQSLIRMRLVLGPFTTVIFTNAVALSHLGFDVQEAPGKPNIYVNDTADFKVITAGEDANMGTMSKNWSFGAQIYYNGNFQVEKTLALPLFASVSQTCDLLAQQLYLAFRNVKELQNIVCYVDILDRDTCQVRVVTPPTINIQLELEENLRIRLRTDSREVYPMKNIIMGYVSPNPTGFLESEEVVAQTGIIAGYVSDITTKGYPGKILFKMIPGKFSWTLYDSHYLPTPYYLDQYDLNKIKVDPLKLTLCRFDARGDPQPLDGEPRKLQCIFVYNAE